MLNPNIGKLLQNYNNKYRLVVDVAHTARDVSQKLEQDGEISIEKPVSIAIDKLASQIDVNK